MKVVLDTNVLLSGLLAPDGTPGHILRAWLEARFDVAMSIEQLAEIGRVLGYSKIQRKLQWDEQRIEQFIWQLYIRTDVVNLHALSVQVPRDPKDMPILATLVASDADILVTRDRDLLDLRGKYPIQTPAEFARRL
ncbi:MAG: putative toxin-antitoxin system toxin component, PIN family [Burkholderiales bacterium]|nr:putative toxin-antitoxin system toxin component, PIN family [Burkholderiales bacterium]